MHTYIHTYITYIYIYIPESEYGDWPWDAGRWLAKSGLLTL